MYDKRIAYDRETKDYAMYLNSRFIGFARTYHEAEVTLDQTVYDLLSDSPPFDDPLPDPGPGGPGVPGDERPLFDDVAQVIDMALGYTHGAASVVGELRRVRARVAQVQDRAVS